MAITYLGDGGRGAGTGNVTYSIPSGTQNGDLLLLVIETANQTVTEPGEWVDVPDSPQGVGTAGGTTATRLKIMYRWVDGTSINTTVTDPGNHQVGAILAFRGVDTTNPFNASAGSTKSATSSSCTFPSITTTVDNCWVLLAEAHALPDSNSNGQTSSQTMASLSDLTEQVDYNTNAGNGGGFSVATGLKATAGSTGTGSATHSAGTSDGTITLALAPLPEAQDLTPNRYDNTNSFFVPTVTRGTVTVAPDRYDNAQAFYTPTVTATGGAQELTPALVTNTQAFYEPAVAATYSLAPALVTNTQAFYEPTVAASYSLSPALVTNASTFYAPTVAASYSLAPSLVTNVSTLYSPSVLATYTLEPGLTGNIQGFPDTTVTTSITLTAALFTNTQTFFAPTISSGGAEIFPPIIDSATTFYSASMAVGAVALEPLLLTNSSAFYVPAVSSGASSIEPGLLTNSQEFYSATVSTSSPARTLSPARLENESQFFAPSVSANNTLSYGLYVDPDYVDSGYVSASAFNQQVFFPATVLQASPQSLVPSLVQNTSVFFSPRIGEPNEAVLGGLRKRRPRQQEFINWVPEPVFDDQTAKIARRRRNELLLL